METSLLKTLASKNQTSVAQEQRRLRGTAKTLVGPRACLKLTIQREGKKPLVTIFGGLPLRRRKKTVIVDEVLRTYPRMRSEIVEKLLNGCSSATTLIMNGLEFGGQEFSKRPDMIRQSSGHARSSGAPLGLDQS